MNVQLVTLDKRLSLTESQRKQVRQLLYQTVSRELKNVRWQQAEYLASLLYHCVGQLKDDQLKKILTESQFKKWLKSRQNKGNGVI